MNLIVITRHLLPLMIGSIVMSAVQAQTGVPRLPAAIPVRSGSVDPSRSTFTWQRPSLRLTTEDEASLNKIHEDRKPAPSAEDPERRRHEKQRIQRDVEDKLRNWLQEWDAAESARHSKADPEPDAVDPTDTVESPDPATPTKPELSQDSAEEPAASSTPPADTVSSNPSESQDKQGSKVSSANTASESGLDLPADVLVDGPVDRIALADNLYAIGEYSLAKEMYGRVERKALTADQQFWVQFQNASCLRRMGDLKAAKKQFRILAGQEEAGWLARSSRWWLDMIEDRAELEQKLASTQSQLDGKRRKFDAAAKK